MRDGSIKENSEEEGKKNEETTEIERRKEKKRNIFGAKSLAYKMCKKAKEHLNDEYWKQCHCSSTTACMFLLLFLYYWKTKDLNFSFFAQKDRKKKTYFPTCNIVQDSHMLYCVDSSTGDKEYIFRFVLRFFHLLPSTSSP